MCDITVQLNLQHIAHPFLCLCAKSTSETLQHAVNMWLESTQHTLQTNQLRRRSNKMVETVTGMHYTSKVVLGFY